MSEARARGAPELVDFLFDRSRRDDVTPPHPARGMDIERGVRGDVDASMSPPGSPTAMRVGDVGGDDAGRRHALMTQRESDDDSFIATTLRALVGPTGDAREGTTRGSAMSGGRSSSTTDAAIEAAIRDAANAARRRRGLDSSESADGGGSGGSVAMNADVGGSGGSVGGVSGGANESSSSAVSLEQHNSRLAGLLSSAERGTPMVALFLLVFVWKHLGMLAMVTWLMYVLTRVNARLVASVSAREERRSHDVAAMSGVLCAHILGIFLLSPTGSRARRVFAVNDSVGGGGVSSDGGFLQCVWDVLVLDLCVKYVFILAKLAVVALPLSALQAAMRRPSTSKPAVKLPAARLYRRRAAVLSAIEYASLACRSLIPAPVWLGYFHRELPGVVASFVTGAYCFAKVRLVAHRGIDFAQATSVWFSWGKRSPAHGESATREELMEAGNVCAICQEDCVDATKLRCSHIFCEDCIGEWFDRQPSSGSSGAKTCPVCRAVVQQGVQKSYGNGQTALFPVLF